MSVKYYIMTLYSIPGITYLYQSVLAFV